MGKYFGSGALLRELASGVLSGALLGSCTAAPLGSTANPIVIPGPWSPPASTLAIANLQYVEPVGGGLIVEPWGHCEPSSTCPDHPAGQCSHVACSPGALFQPGTRALADFIHARWQYTRILGQGGCVRNGNTTVRPDTHLRYCEYLSIHATGRAIDVMVTPIGRDADNTSGDPIGNWLIEHAEYIGVQRVIWDHRSWVGNLRGRHLVDLPSSIDAHVNHLHVELTPDAANRRTRFFTEGPPPVTCDPHCVSATGLVGADCAYVDCAATGLLCLGTPARCAPGVPEPAEAAHHPERGLPGVSLLGGLTRFQPLSGTRLFDTRDATSTALRRSDGSLSGPLDANRSGTLTTFPGTPANTAAVWLNVTAVPTTAAGFVWAFPTGAMVTGSTVNFAPDRVRSNAAAVVLGAGGGITFEAPTPVHVVADMSGAFTTSGGLGLRTAGPLRVFDTRSVGLALTPGTPLAVDMHAPSDARAVAASVTANPPAGAPGGFVVAYPCGSPMPATSSINYNAGVSSTNTILTELHSGQVCFAASGPVDLSIDVVGYLVPDGELSYQPLVPTRLLDTRSATALYTGRVGESQVLQLPLQSAAGMPPGVLAAVVNVTTVDADARGFVSIQRCDEAYTGTASLETDVGRSVGSLALSRVTDGSLCLLANTRSNLIVDLLGVWVPTPGAPPPTDGPRAPEDLPENGPTEEPADGGLAPDANAGNEAGTDAGTTPRGAPGCACRAAPRGSAQGTPSRVAALLFLLALRRRLRSPRTS